MRPYDNLFYDITNNQIVYKPTFVELSLIPLDRVRFVVSNKKQIEFLLTFIKDNLPQEIKDYLLIDSFSPLNSYFCHPKTKYTIFRYDEIDNINIKLLSERNFEDEMQLKLFLDKTTSYKFIKLNG